MPATGTLRVGKHLVISSRIRGKMMQVKTLLKCKLILDNILNDYTLPLIEASERDEYCPAICFPLVSQTPAPLTSSNNTLHNELPSPPPPPHFTRKDFTIVFHRQCLQ